MPKINRMSQPFFHIENIKAFLDGCRALGIPSRDLFDTNDLYEAKLLKQARALVTCQLTVFTMLTAWRALVQVAHCLLTLGDLARSLPSFPGPYPASAHLRRPSGFLDPSAVASVAASPAVPPHKPTGRLPALAAATSAYVKRRAQRTRNTQQGYLQLVLLALSFELLLLLLQTVAMFLLQQPCHHRERGAIAHRIRQRVTNRRQ